MMERGLARERWGSVHALAPPRSARFVAPCQHHRAVDVCRVEPRTCRRKPEWSAVHGTASECGSTAASHIGEQEGVLIQSQVAVGAGGGSQHHAWVHQHAAADVRPCKTAGRLQGASGEGEGRQRLAKAGTRG